MHGSAFSVVVCFSVLLIYVFVCFQAEIEKCHTGAATLKQLFEATRARFNDPFLPLDPSYLGYHQMNDEGWQKALTELNMTTDLLRVLESSHKRDEEATMEVLCKLEDDMQSIEAVAAMKAPFLPDPIELNPTGDPVRVMASLSWCY